MWMQRLSEKYGKEFHPTGEEEEDEVFSRQSEENIRRIYTKRFFQVDVLSKKSPDRTKIRLRGLCLTLFSAFCISVVFYMWYHCYHASCSECTVAVSKAYPDTDKEIVCDCANCIINYIFNPKTHFEKCYYSLFFINSMIVLYIFSIIKKLAFEIFRHSNLLQPD